MSAAPTKHYRLSPSGSKRWLACPGSARNDLPQSMTWQAAAGNVGHEQASFRFDHGLPIFGNDVFADAARKYVAFAATIPGESLHEQEIESELIPEYGGTLDTVKLTSDTIHIVDLKTGKWKVPSKANPQLLCYTTLAREKWPGRTKFFASIVQPRVYAKPQTVMFTTAELDAHIARVIMASQSKAIVAGEQCRFCPLLPTCKTGQKWASQQTWKAGLEPKT